ncbi:MAG TPA: gliding motility-associated C-terminal domain-containing protein [Flavisolibacter sp.]|nr:gliding motility-associated C-terminal domain-containing protein [Flavisolibacter sp.]
MKTIFFITALFAMASMATAQTCTTPGQTPATAFPVCGTSVFQQTTVPICGGRTLAVPGCSGGGYADKNPFWYKFTCYQAGTLGFVITPNSATSDYDWQLYDITGRDPNDVFTDVSLVVTANWAGTYAPTGASSSGVNGIQCGSDPAANRPTFAAMPQLKQGHTYLLLVSHFSDNQSGYSLSFGGGTAVITDPIIPHLKSVEASCGGDIVRVSLTKKIKCSSIAANGSDFSITAPGIQITKSTGFGCNAGFDADSIELQLSGFLDPGTYTLRVKNGMDNNTLLDYCDRALPENETIQVTILPKAPTPMDSLAPVACAPKQLRLLFKKPMLCSSVAANGSDFMVNGNYPVSVSAAVGTCTNGLTKEILVTLSKPMEDAGNFQIVLRNGNDGNTIIDECGEETLAGSALSFVIKDTVNADFTYAIEYACSVDRVQFMHPGKNDVSEWNWNLDENQNSTLQNPMGQYRVFNTKNVRLIVSNGFCKDTVTKNIILENALKADFAVLEDNCPNEAIPFTSLAEGRIVSHSWSFGDGSTAAIQHPSHTYTVPFRETAYPVKYTVTDEWGCQQTAEKRVIIYTSCLLVLPNAFTPNRDGRNDWFYPLNAIKAEQLEFVVYNRWGQELYRTNNWKQGWDGTYRGQPQPTGVYVWMLRYTDRDTKQKKEQKGTVTLIR